MEALYIEEQQHRDQIIAGRERAIMVKEDRRSRLVEEYWKECQLFEQSAAAASKRATTLQKHREDDEVKRLEVLKRLLISRSEMLTNPVCDAQLD
mgnify:CR=1 FL=1